MKLYTLFEDIISEESLKNKQLLTEGVSEQTVMDAINNKYYVNIEYDDYPNNPTSVPSSIRYLQVYCLGRTVGGPNAGNLAIRAFQVQGPHKRTPKSDMGQWRLFRLDRIRGWHPTKMKFHKPVSSLPSYPASEPKFNPNGDKKLSGARCVDFSNLNNNLEQNKQL